MLTHLYTVYTKIKPSDLEENDKRMKTAYDVNLLIEIFFDQTEDTIEFASTRNAPFTPMQVVNTSFNIISSTGMFQDYCKLWKQKPEADKTWNQFKIDFAIAHSELIESAQTAQMVVFQANNTTEVQRDTASTISSLANATQSNHVYMAALTTTITHLTMPLAEANEELVTPLARIAVLERDLATSKGKQTPSPTDGALRITWRKLFSLTHYCHTYGPKCSNPSKYCVKKANGHQNDANDVNRMGGGGARRSDRSGLHTIKAETVLCVI